MAPRKTSAKAPAKSQPSSAQAEVDEQLARYRAMRDFQVTAEPNGEGGAATGVPWMPAGGLPFVIQKHAATRLHYDFRLGWRGVLKSWACAKGPSYNTHDRRLAVEVEDHPMEYGGFEGTIPKGQYGGGTVMLWDQGTWEPLPDHDFDEGLRKGTVKFTLHGQKLEGRWTLVRMKPRAGEQAGKPNWLLIKEHDGQERPDTAPPITEQSPDSVATGRSLEAIAAAEDHVWNSRPAEGTPAPANRSRLRERVQAARTHRAGAAAEPAGRPQERLQERPQDGAQDRARNGAQDGVQDGTEDRAQDRPQSRPQAVLPAAHSTAQSWLDGAPAESMPTFLPPQLATSAAAVPPGSGWLHELKLDGYRVQLHVRAKAKGKRDVALFTRKGLDWTYRMKTVAHAAGKLPVDQAVLDGEVVVLDEAGKTSFSKLQAAFEQGEAATLQFFAFDLLHLDGRNLRGLPLRIRKQLLEPLIEGAGDPLLGYSAHLQLAADQVFAHACALGAEGILSKAVESRYVSGRSDSWLKLKCTHRQDFVIAGFTPPGDGGSGIGSLVLGYYEGEKLIHCGRCGTGFSQASAREVRKQLEPLRTAKPAYHSPLAREAKKDAIWLRPELVCEVQFATWTADGAVRHASFQGMRLDKPAREVRKETPVLPAAAPKQEHEHEQEPEQDQEQDQEKNQKRAVVPASAAAPGAKGKAPRLTHPDKIVDTATALTKQQLAAFFEAVAPAMLPHLANRPLSIVRCPAGSTAQCFFQKHVKAGLPSSVGSIEVPDRDDPARTEPYIEVDSAAALLGLAQLGVLELHPWGSQANALEQPDRLIFDLDPDESLPWSTVVASAEAIRSFLRDLQLESFVKTTGGKGLHIVVAIQPSAEWPEIRLFSRGIAAAIESTDPKLYLIKMTKAARKGRIFVDWMRNERGATAVAPWSPRARAGMRVAVPLDWDELAAGQPDCAVANFDQWRSRIEPKNNPWAAMRPQPLLPEVLRTVLETSAAAERLLRRRG